MYISNQRTAEYFQNLTVEWWFLCEKEEMIRDHRKTNKRDRKPAAWERRESCLSRNVGSSSSTNSCLGTQNTWNTCTRIHTRVADIGNNKVIINVVRNTRLATNEMSVVEHHLDKAKRKYLSMGAHVVNIQIGNYKCRARPRFYPHDCTFVSETVCVQW